MIRCAKVVERCKPVRSSVVICNLRKNMYICKIFAKVQRIDHIAAEKMKRIGILSDTHGKIPQQVYTFFKDCDELWHAGDMGGGVMETLQEFKPLVAVYGNCDSWDVRHVAPETQLFVREGMKIVMTHIGGYPGHYERRLLPIFESEKPAIFVSGHSHILRVMYDKGYEMLHINPGAAGQQGFHQKATLVRLTLDGTPKNLEICEFDKFQQ